MKPDRVALLITDPPLLTPPRCTVVWSTKTELYVMTGTAYLLSPVTPNFRTNDAQLFFHDLGLPKTVLHCLFYGCWHYLLQS